MRIRPISDLRNKSREIAAICHDTGEPILITKDGRDDLVVMSVAAWERDRARLDLYVKLDEAEADLKHGHRGTSVAALRRKLLHRAR